MKSDDQFPIDNRRPGRLYAYCKVCKVEYMRAWRTADPEGARQRQRRSNIGRLGVTPERFDEMLAEQGGRCAICSTTDPGQSHGRMSIDHDHSTGAVRALLCHGCNAGLGNFKDDPDALEAAARYLRAHRCDTPTTAVELPAVKLSDPLSESTTRENAS